MTFYESLAPLVKVVGPQADAIVTVDQPVELVIIATDHADVASISFNIGGELLGGPVENPDVTAVETYTWRPDGRGASHNKHNGNQYEWHHQRTDDDQLELSSPRQQVRQSQRLRQSRNPQPKINTLLRETTPFIE